MKHRQCRYKTWTEHQTQSTMWVVELGHLALAKAQELVQEWRLLVEGDQEWVMVCSKDPEERRSKVCPSNCH
jgi:hypothetical protein